MKILKINKFYFVKGGSERYYFELKSILEEHGHQVVPFSMAHPNNFQTEFASFFVDHIEFDQLPKWQALIQAPRILSRILYSFQAKKRLRALIEKNRPDIAHLHMIDHQLSPSILDVLQEYQIPTVQTLHQYKLVCPNYRLYNPRTGQVCEKCIRGSALHPILERCHKGSAVYSIPLAIESTFHRLFHFWDKIDLFHAPSHFMKRKMVEAGFPEEKVVQRFYTIQVEKYPYSETIGDYAIYFGRLSEEKGIPVLLRAMAANRSTKLLLVGEGPERPKLEKLVREWHLSNVIFTGYKSGKELQELVARSRFVVIPSIWYDNSPLVIYESFALGKPVIGSDIGGISELIDHGENGFLFQPTDSEALATYIEKMGRDAELVRQFGSRARQKAEEHFRPAEHYDWLMKIYRSLLQ